MDGDQGQSRQAENQKRDKQKLQVAVKNTLLPSLQPNGDHVELAQVNQYIQE